ncbi:YggT family protein [Nostocoides sp.]|jgi:YggT family protein|uniref:YggT family protein n=1 Tax=Nostocoides sp. TaxID=1917966 RepID=UPI002CADB7E3|nr:YggT family protein [Tetrasphaera sp.]
MDLVREILRTALFLYFLLLIGRLIFEWVQVFAREWRPRGPVLVVAEGIYTATDPPLKALRRVIPPLRLGNVGIDLSFLVLMLGISLLMSIL